MASTFTVSGQLVDIQNREIFPAAVTVAEGKIITVTRVEHAPEQYLMPGFIDAHIHIESSMLVPQQFAAIAVTHGTIATVSDPHEIANVCGVEGVDYMIRNAASSPLKCYFGAPSCVPATPFETAGAVIGPEEIDALLGRDEIKYLAEMMNFPGVLHRDEGVMAKIASAKKHRKPVDGHAPGLRGQDAAAYASAGITTDHECVSLEEALDKIAAGVFILIREGSAAKNYVALSPLLSSHPGCVMFCSDDKHPDELIKGHINTLVARAVADGHPVFDVLHAACILPAVHYNLETGMLHEGDPADFIVVSDLKAFRVLEVYIDGNLVAEQGTSHVSVRPPEAINNFNIRSKAAQDFRLITDSLENRITCKVIDAMDGQLVTGVSTAVLPIQEGCILADADQDVLKIGIVNRYSDAPVAMGFIRNFGLKRGAMASSVAHDSHNIVFVGVTDEDICNAVNEVIAHRGGISIAAGGHTDVMPLPVAGLMSDQDAWTAASQYERLDKAAKALGSTLTAPFMTLSFMALPVIPALKMTDKGLFDVNAFTFAALTSPSEQH